MHLTGVDIYLNILVKKSKRKTQILVSRCQRSLPGLSADRSESCWPIKHQTDAFSVTAHWYFYSTSISFAIVVVVIL